MATILSDEQAARFGYVVKAKVDRPAALRSRQAVLQHEHGVTPPARSLATRKPAGPPSLSATESTHVNFLLNVAGDDRLSKELRDGAVQTLADNGISAAGALATREKRANIAANTARENAAAAQRRARDKARGL